MNLKDTLERLEMFKLKEAYLLKESEEKNPIGASGSYEIDALESAITLLKRYSEALEKYAMLPHKHLVGIAREALWPGEPVVMMEVRYPCEAVCPVCGPVTVTDGECPKCSAGPNLMKFQWYNAQETHGVDHMGNNFDNRSSQSTDEPTDEFGTRLG